MVMGRCGAGLMEFQFAAKYTNGFAKQGKRIWEIGVKANAVDFVCCNHDPYRCCGFFKGVRPSA